MACADSMPGRSDQLSCTAPLYGRVTWGSPQISQLHREQRRVAIRVFRAYRTVSWEAACEVSGMPPWLMVADSMHTIGYILSEAWDGPQPWGSSLDCKSGRSIEAPVLAARIGLMETMAGPRSHKDRPARCYGAIQFVLERGWNAGTEWWRTDSCRCSPDIVVSVSTCVKGQKARTL